MNNKYAGVLLPISSLPSKYGIGCFSKEAYDFVLNMRKAGQTFWQILPIHPTSYGDSPYQSFSTFAGNPYFISLEALIEEGVLTEEECEAYEWGDHTSYIDYEKLYYNRYPLLRKAYERSDISKNPAYQAFISENHWWLYDYALFMALKNFFGGVSWSEWPEDIRLRWGNALDYYRRELYFDIEFQMYMQFKFFEQYVQLKAFANENGVKIVGDIPIYVSMDSADTWANPALFRLDEENLPIAVAGCPPDGFSATGQLWGNPLYRWDYHKETGYQWWVTRLWYCFKLYDVTRIDHFRGFDEYYAIPYGEETAVNGEWEKGPGMDLFRTVQEKLGENEVIAEDLGYMTDTVRKMVEESGFPNMKVLEFAFDARDTGSANDYLPHNYPENCVAYTGTHDNETLVGWFDSITAEEQKLVRDYLVDDRTAKKKLYRPLIALVMRSNAKYVIIPMQDYLGLDNSARMNHPSTLGGNWCWRLAPGQLTEEALGEIENFTRRFGRLSEVIRKEENEKAEKAKKEAEEAIEETSEE
ncbi:MAG: 4-alpha-glucanotransferase [Clostridia bacterium]|nr:4-alpha-glucanotransferase [Clostridia bacterium]MBQ4157175.1 4-alpha-glucanotransferase [Clostridia bacterium]